LVRIKNAQQAGKKTLKATFSNMDFDIAKILVETGYLKGVKKKTIDKKNFLEIELVPKGDIKAMRDFKFLSKPGRRFYVGYRALKPVKQGYGLAVLSTPKGIMTNIGARKNKVGGEYLFQIW